MQFSIENGQSRKLRGNAWGTGCMAQIRRMGHGSHQYALALPKPTQRCLALNSPLHPHPSGRVRSPRDTRRICDCPMPVDMKWKWRPQPYIRTGAVTADYQSHFEGAVVGCLRDRKSAMVI